MTTTLSESDLRAALTPELADVLDYLRVYEQHEDELPAYAEVSRRGHGGGFLGLEVRGYVHRPNDGQGVHLTEKGRQAVAALELLDEKGRGISRCPVDGDLQWIDDSRIGGDRRDPSMVLTLACGHISL